MNTAIRKPRWILIPPRVALITFIFTLLSFAVSLFLGILGVVIASRIRGVHPEMALAYRYVAAPCALLVGIMVLISATALEIRHYRQTKALLGIERSSAA